MAYLLCVALLLVWWWISPAALWSRSSTRRQKNQLQLCTSKPHVGRRRCSKWIKTPAADGPQWSCPVKANTSVDVTVSLPILKKSFRNELANRASIAAIVMATNTWKWLLIVCLLFDHWRPFYIPPAWVPGAVYTNSRIHWNHKFFKTALEKKKHI